MLDLTRFLEREPVSTSLENALSGLYFGGSSSPLVQPTASDLNGSHATVLISAWAHLRHAKLRRSKPSGPSETAVVTIRVRQLGQRGQCIGNSSGSGLFVPGMRLK